MMAKLVALRPGPVCPLLVAALLVALLVAPGSGQLSQPCPRAVRINTNHQYRNQLHFICLQLTGSLPRLDVIQFAGQQLVFSQTVDELGANQMTSFVDDEGSLQIILADLNRINGTSLYSVDPNGRLGDKHTINSQLVSALAVWRLQLNLEWQLAIANQPFYERHITGQLPATRLPEPKPMITVHSWRSTYFDSYQIIELPHDGRINKLEPMNINGQEFLVVAMESQQLDQSERAESLVYKLDFGDGTLNWLLYQSLPTELAFDLRAFAISHRHSLQRDHYLALLGQGYAKDELGLQRNESAAELDSEYGLIIYKYMGDRFLPVNSIPAPDATKLDALSFGAGDSYVVIALLSGPSNQVSLYSFDGLTLAPVAAPPSSSQQLQPPPAPGARPRRTMDTSDLHLFLAPPNSQSGIDKRTLAEDTIEIPLLALTNSAALESEEVDAPESASSSVYQIPTPQNSPEGAQDQDPGHVKRDFVGSNMGASLLTWCKATIDSVLHDNFDSSAQQLLSLPRINQRLPIEINGDLIIDDDLHVSNLLLANRVEELRGQESLLLVGGGPPIGNFSFTFDRIEQAHQEIDQVKNQIDQILVDDGSVQEIFNPLTFDTLVVECPDVQAPLQRAHLLGPSSIQCPHVDDLRTMRLNNRDVSNISSQALLTGRSMIINRNVRFEHLILRGNVEIEGTLNGIPVGDIVFKRGPQTSPIIGQKTFLNGLFSSSHLLVENWNGQRVDRNTHLTSTGDQRIEATLAFGQLVIDSGSKQMMYNFSSRIEKLNEIHLDSHLSQLSLLDSDNNFELPIHFDELVLSGPVQFVAQSRLASVDLEDLWLNAMFKHTIQNVTAPMEFQGDVHVSYGGDMIVGGQLNGIQFKPGSVLMRDRDAVIPNPVIFEHDVVTRDLTIAKALNGIQVLLNPESRRYELAILYNTGNQLLTSDKVFDEIYLGGNSIISGNINGHLNLSQLYALAMSDGNQFRFNTIRLSGRNIRIDDRASIHIDSTINGFPADEVCSLALKVAQAPRTRYQRLRFDQPIRFRSLRCAAINGFNNLTNVFLTKHGNQRVAGTLRLINGLLVNTTLNVAATLNNFDVAPLARSIAQSVNESLSGLKEVRGDLVVDDLFTDRINDLPLSSIFLAKSDSAQHIRAPMTFNHLDIENVLVVDQNMATNLFNGLNVTDVLVNTLQYDKPQVIFNHMELNTLQLLPNANLLTKSINGHDLRRLYDDAVLVDVPQQVLAPKTFRAPVDFSDRLSLRYGIDALSDEELKSNLLLQSDELIDDDLEFNTDVIIKKELEIQTGVINDIDINSFVDSIIYENQPGKKGMRVAGNGSVRFRDVRLNNLVVAGTIQGIDLSREALLRSDNSNGTYNAHIRHQQIVNNNQRLIDSLYGPGSSFQVATNYQGQRHLGTCFVHSCARSSSSPRPPAPINLKPSVPYKLADLVPSVAFRQASPVTQVVQRPVELSRPQSYKQIMVMSPPPAPQIQQTPLPPSQLPTVTLKQVDAPPPPPITWRPIEVQPVFVHKPANVALPIDMSPKFEPAMQLFSVPPQPSGSRGLSMPDLQMVDYQSLMRVQAIDELSHRINKYLSVSFYYEIVQKHPLLGPLLHAAKNPIASEQGSSLLLLRGTSQPGEPCLQRGQTIAVMAQQRGRHPTSLFTQSSRIQDTSNPSRVASVEIGSSHYMFVLDSVWTSSSNVATQLLVYLWNHQLGMYELRERITVQGHPSAMKAFASGSRACVVLANPRFNQANQSGSPVLYCQKTFNSDFSTQIYLPVSDVFELDVIKVPSSNLILFATLSQKHAEQVGDLSVVMLSLGSLPTMGRVTRRRMVRPLKLHFVAGGRPELPIQLVVSEAITSCDDTQANTRIFTLTFSPESFGGRVGVNSTQFHESQVFRDNQFHDIQSVALDDRNSLLFFQSAHSISIYAPNTSPGCQAAGYLLVQRLPTKGANKFLVFNEGAAYKSTSSKHPLGHFLVLTKDYCEHQNLATLILRAKFD